MGISAQQILQSDPEYLQRELAAKEAQRVNPQGTAAGAIGALLGRGISNISQGKGFFQTPDYGLQRVSDVQSIMKSVTYDPSNPQSYYEQVGQLLQQAGYSDIAPLAFNEARKVQIEDRKIGIQEEDLKLKREAATKKVSSEQTTTKGLRVFRRGDGPLMVEEGGKDVAYDPAKHGRFETAQDRVRDRPSFSYKTDRMGNTQVYQDGQLIRTDPAPWMQGGPAAPTPGKSNVRTLEDLRKSLAGQK